MKKKSILYTIATLCAGILLSHCKYNTDIANPTDYVKIYMPQAIEAPAKRTFTMSDTEQRIIFGAAYGGTDYPAQNIDVSFKVSDDLVQTFNAANGTSYAVMPQGSYAIDNTTGTIAKGELKTKPLSIKVKTSGVLEPFKQYLLPVTIAQVSGQTAVNEALRTSYFLIEAQRDGITLKVMSYGIGSAFKDMNALAASVNEQNPDLLVIREVDVNTTRSGPANLPSILAPLIGMPNYFFANALVYQGGLYGTAVFSKYPISESIAYQLASTGSEKGPLGIVTVQINDQQKLVFAGTHLNSTVAIRNSQTTALLDITKNYTTDPMILAGNFNDKPITGDTYLQLATQFSFPCTTCPPNYSNTDPKTNSDMIMFKPANRFRVLSYKVGTTSVGTHLPVMSQIQLFY